MERPAPAGSAEHDPAVEAATETARGALVGVRVVKVDSEVRRYSDITFTYVVPVIEVYLNAATADTAELASLAPPWSATPWHVLVLMEEASSGASAPFSAAEARRRGVRWLDLARDPKLEELGATPRDARRARTTCPRRSRGWWRPTRRRPAGPPLRQFAQRRGHYLVTNGPYQLDKWSDAA